MSASAPLASMRSSGPGSSGSARAMPHSGTPRRGQRPSRRRRRGEATGVVLRAQRSTGLRADRESSESGPRPERRPAKSGSGRKLAISIRALPSPDMARRLDLQAWDGLPGTVERGQGWALVQGDCSRRWSACRRSRSTSSSPTRRTTSRTAARPARAAAASSVDKGGWDASRGVVEDHGFQPRWLAACRRVLKPSGTLWVSGTQHVIFSSATRCRSSASTCSTRSPGTSRTPSPTWPAASSPTRRRSCSGRAREERGRSPHRFDYRAMKAENGGKQMRDLWEI